MRGLVTAALLGFAAALPAPQLIPLDEIPEYTTTLSIDPGLTAHIITYNPTTATKSVVAEVTSNPLPQEKRDVNHLKARDACSLQSTQTNTYNVDLSSAAAFRADGNISSVANSAPSVNGYTKNFSNLLKASSAYGYLGYQTVSSYDPSICAAKCTSMAGCLSFNIYFERDPVLEPGTGCSDPAAFANIKCSYWGAPLTVTTATNGGQFRASFEVAIAGSNGYTTNAFQTIKGYTGPTFLNQAAINAPLDCNGDDTYLGYKFFNDGPDGSSPKLCRFINTYILQKNGVGQGQYCSMYTQAWNSTYATNTGQYRGSDKYTISYSFSYYNSTDAGSPVCGSNDKAALSYLSTSGGDFCTAYNSYSAPTSTVSATITPGVSTAVQTAFVTVTSTPSVQYVTSKYTVLSTVIPDADTVSATETQYSTATVVTTTTVTPAPNAKRGETVDPEYSIAVETVHFSVSKPPPSKVYRRAASTTPAVLSGWPASKISSACSRIATGSVTRTITVTAPASVVSVFTTATAVVTAEAPVSTVSEGTTEVVTAGGSVTTVFTTVTLGTTITQTSTYTVPSIPTTTSTSSLSSSTSDVSSSSTSDISFSTTSDVSSTSTSETSSASTSVASSTSSSDVSSTSASDVSSTSTSVASSTSTSDVSSTSTSEVPSTSASDVSSTSTSSVSSSSTSDVSSTSTSDVSPTSASSVSSSSTSEVSSTSASEASTTSTSALSSSTESTSSGSVTSSTSSSTSDASITSTSTSDVSATSTSTSISDVSTTSTLSISTTSSVSSTTSTSSVSSTTSTVPTATPTSITGGYQGEADEDWFNLELPFAIGGFGSYNTSVHLMVNGLLSLNLVDYDTQFNQYQNEGLPSSQLPDITFAPLWDDLKLWSGEDSKQGIFYDISGDIGSRTVTFEYYIGTYNDATDISHFTMTFYEDRQGVVDYKYYEVNGNGDSVTVGAQQSGEKALQYSFDQAIVTAGLVVTLDTNAMTVSTSSFTTE
ncbi:hypothetical protein H2203_002085 [Taxawa tesnikishii (nom. ined.)]|nr:hypothetical protein H2203_002085 [Dothideales sp. JES 119]